VTLANRGLPVAIIEGFERLQYRLELSNNQFPSAIEPKKAYLGQLYLKD
jgi:hypothetical protein